MYDAIAVKELQIQPYLTAKATSYVFLTRNTFKASNLNVQEKQFLTDTLVLVPLPNNTSAHLLIPPKPSHNFTKTIDI